MAEELAVVVGRHDERLTGLEDWRADHEKRQNGSLEKIWVELKEMRIEYSHRPTWLVTLALSVMGSIIVGLSVKFIVG